MHRAKTTFQRRSALDRVVPSNLASPMKAHTRTNVISGRGGRGTYGGEG